MKKTVMSLVVTFISFGVYAQNKPHKEIERLNLVIQKMKEEETKVKTCTSGLMDKIVNYGTASFDYGMELFIGNRYSADTKQKLREYIASDLIERCSTVGQ